MTNLSRKNFRLGIIGGMGAAASNYFQTVVIAKKNAKTDQDNMPMVCITNTDIPDRTAYLLNPETATNPVPQIMQSIKDLEKLNVFYAVITCNTAHAFLEELQKKTDIALLDMVKQTVCHIKEMKNQNPNIAVGLLATTGTCQTGIYDTQFSEQGINLHKPDAITQTKNVHNAIYGDTEQKGIKGNEFIKTASLLGDAIDSMIEKDSVNTIILGCTELPLVRDSLEKKFPDIVFIDPMDVIADTAINIFDKALELIHKKPMLNNTDKNVLTLEKTDDYAEYIALQAYKRV